MIKKEGSVRVDLLGGTLDLNPINLILPDVVTLNLATSLKAKVTIEAGEDRGVEIISKDYNSSEFFLKEDFTPEKLNGEYFGPLGFVAQILELFGVHQGVKLTLESGSPPGAGLGGSSSMGVTLYSALAEYKKLPLERLQAITRVNGIESRILDSGPAGYQDYYPALFGGVLALHPSPGAVEVEQMFTPELKEVLEKRVSLIYSGQTRLSGINNWEVYKKFFDKVPQTREGLVDIAKLSHRAYRAIKEKKYDLLVDLIGQEGARRKELFPGIVSSSMDSMYNDIKGQVSELGMKVCGAGGGGCFLLTHAPENKERVHELVSQSAMSVLDFQVEAPL